MNDRYVTIGKKIEAGLRAAIPAVWVCAGLLTACMADDLPAPEAGEVPPATLPAAGIYVSGGRPDVALSTGKRYVEPGDTVSGPQIEGICKADRVDVFVYTHNGQILAQHPGAENHTWEATIASTPLNVMGLDRYAKVFYHTEKSGKNYRYHMVSALAYSEADRGSQEAPNFNIKTGENREKLTFSLRDKATSTPELYYGVLHGTGVSETTEKIDNVVADGDDAIRYYTANLLEKETDITLKGRIFRIVSQINLEVTEVEKALVDSMVLKADNYPRQITLYGSHGTNYPVAACTASNTSGATSVALDHVAFAEKDTLGATTVRLSSFFLPSEAGMHLSLYIHYRDSVMNSDGSKYLEKTYDLRPARSYYLSGADAEAYKVGGDLTGDNGLYVYDGRKDKYCFYSYANVRVNLTGPFANFAASDSNPEITIEVEPNFEKEHHYEIAN